MACTVCSSKNLQRYPTEIAIHVSDRDKPLVFVFPEILVCMNCGRPEFAEDFVIPEGEMKLLSKGATRE